MRPPAWTCSRALKAVGSRAPARHVRFVPEADSCTAATRPRYCKKILDWSYPYSLGAACVGGDGVDLLLHDLEPPSSTPINFYATAICRVVGPSPSSVVRRMSRTSLVSL